MSNQSSSNRFSNDLFYLMVYWNGKPVSQFLQTHSPHVLGYEDIDGIKTVKVEVDVDDKDFTRKEYLWFALQYGMAVKQAQVIVAHKGEKPVFSMVLKAKNFQEYKKEFWLPAWVERQMFNIKNGKAEWDTTNLFETDKLTLDTPNITDLFKLQFHVGALVFSGEEGIGKRIGGTVDKDQVSLEKAPAIISLGAYGKPN